VSTCQRRCWLSDHSYLDIFPQKGHLREREYLTPKEVDRLQDAARKHSRYGHRDATAILIAYPPRAPGSELCELTWNMIELDSGRIHVRRAKNGVDSTHPLTGKEIRALRQLQRENLQSRFLPREAHLA
jgi:type 1 fimbriae regulatory protein FimB/type 1 fimbriae regulatory protein FimE